MLVTANFTVYLQALGGKFLGPNAYQHNDINVTLSYSGGCVQLPYMVTPGVTDDGMISQGFATGASSFMPILTMPVLAAQNPQVFYLSPGVHTISATHTLHISSVERAILTAAVPTPTGQALVFTQPVLLTPQQTDYKVTMVVPGLLLLPGTVDPGTGSISVFVTMMCGCKVTQGLANSFWSPGDFTVSALVQYSNGRQQTCSLSLDASTNNSLFRAVLTDTSPVQSITFTALQHSTNNYGSLVQTFQETVQ